MIMKSISTLLKDGIVIGDGGYLIELERRGYVESGSRREKVGTGKGSGQFTPEVAIENPDALRELHREFVRAGAHVLQALTFFGTREKLNRAGYGAQTETINTAAVKLAKDVAAEGAGRGVPAEPRLTGTVRPTVTQQTLVAGSVSRTQIVEREGMGALDKARDHIAEQIHLLKDAGVDFLILETFFNHAEMKIAHH
jgi:betaine-homocysteine S-methyltransferase